MTDATNSAESRPRPGGIAELAGRSVSRIGYGAMQLERLHDDRSAALAIIRLAVELGVDHFDTAQFYGNGFSNEMLREALRPEDDVAIVSKVGADPDPGGTFPMRPAQRPEELRASVEENLRALDIDQLSVVNLRRMDAGISIPLSDDQVIGLDDQLAEMIALRDEGLIGGIGLSNVTIDGLRQALPAGLACVQNAYSLVARDDDDMLDLCSSQGIAWVPFFPLGGSYSGLSKVTDESTVTQIAADRGVSPSQIGLAWLLHRAPNVLLIPGTASLNHLEANTAVGDIVLNADELAVLDSIPSREVGAIGGE